MVQRAPRPAVRDVPARTIPLEVPPLSTLGFYPLAKRTLDVVVVLALALVCSPLLAALALAVKLTSSGPVIYRQVRLGRGRRPFLIWKIRTMYDDCERLSGPRWSTEDDPRVTPVGRFLRRTHLDELPQLWNILNGDMSLVGPRPERPEFVVDLERELPRYGDRLTMPPGLTGLAQVNLPPDTDQESVRRKLAFDLHYVGNASLWLDVRLLASTALFLAGVPFAASTRALGLCPFGVRISPGRPSLAHEAVEMVGASQSVAAWNES